MLVQAKGAGEPVDGVRPGMLPAASFERGYRVRADSGALGEGLLGQAGRHPQPVQCAAQTRAPGTCAAIQSHAWTLLRAIVS